jgi:hypothetical protein
MYKKGDKVVPHSKSIGCSLNDSEEWERAQASGQNFLYVTSISNEDDYWCAFTKNDDDSECFSQVDLTPYIEEKYQENGILLNFSGVKLNEYKVSDILELVNKGILKETDEIIVGRK